MSTWHQRNGQRRDREAGVVNPFAHATQWRVMEDPPNQMMCGLGLFASAELAYAEAARGPHRFVVPPRDTNASGVSP